MTTEPINLDALRRLEAAATKAPWQHPYEDTNPGDKGWWILGGGPGMGEHAVAVALDYNPNAEADAEFIAAARNAMPSLLAELDRYHALHDWLEASFPNKDVEDSELAEQLAKVNGLSTRRPVPVTVEWAAEIRYLNGGVKHTAATDKDFATIAADSVNVHIESLNEPTRQEHGVEGARVVSREVRDFPDGSRLIGPWKPVESAAEVS